MAANLSSCSSSLIEFSEGLAKSIAVNRCSCLSLYIAPSILLTKITPKNFSRSTKNWSQRAKSLLFLHNTSLTHISFKLIVIFQIIPHRFFHYNSRQYILPTLFFFPYFYFIFIRYTQNFSPARPQPRRIFDKDTAVLAIILQIILL